MQVSAVEEAEVGLSGRVWERVRGLFGAGAPPALDPAREDLTVVVRGFDEVQACSAALAAAPGWVPEAPAVLRHHLVLNGVDRASAVELAVATAAQDGYRPDTRPVTSGADLVLVRVQVLDALHLSQERSRMVGLAQRLGGHVLGWDALQPGSFEPAPPATVPDR
ncbi:MAG: hypothetical protein ABI181_11595 [Mycobacteriaceae bacterium]